MYLALKDLAFLFHEHLGAEEDFQVFTVTDHSMAIQPKGVFVPINEGSGDLLEAIANGAIAAIWDKEKKIPRYRPTHFPLFFTKDPVEAVQKVLKLYIEKLNGEADKKMKTTKFDFLNKKLLNKNNQTYDISVMLEKIATPSHSDDVERRG